MHPVKPVAPVGGSSTGLWVGPTLELRRAAESGELLVARIRVVVVSALLPTPLFHLLDGPFPVEGYVGLVLLAVATVFSWLIFLRARVGELTFPGFVLSSILDVSLITLALGLDSAFGDPFIATNSQFVFMLYVLAIGATALRYDQRICLVVGGLAILEYVILLAVCIPVFSLAEPGVASPVYGRFSWHTVFTRVMVLAAQTYLSLVIVRRSSQLWSLSLQDSHTGLFNYAFFNERISEELARFRRTGRPLVLAMVDIDYFKSVNDRFGHRLGDAALVEIAETLRKGLREEDSACRYGGDEFALILSGTEPEAALRRLEQLREQIAALRISSQDESVRLTVSIGAAVAPQDGDRSSALLEVADRRLYRAKELGRDRLVAKG